jgi:deazaflavin-dependent oxidoreductase (nitroreductase family)
MSDARSEKLAATIRSHLEAYLRTGGREGHMLDGRGAGGHNFSTNLLVRYKGRKSGRTMITPLCYGSIGGEIVVVGSKGGSEAHPAWYLNLTSSPEIDFQIATQAFRATWREPQGAERDKVWAYMVDCYPFYATYQEKTERQIPLVMMTPVESLPVFSEADLG